MKNYNVIPEGIIERFNTLKMRELQVEYLVSESIASKDELPNIQEMAKLFPKKEWEFSEESFVQLESCCNNYIKTLTAAIPQDLLDAWEEEGDTSQFTHANYGRRFWNEIELPVLTEMHFEVFKNLVECGSDNSKAGACIALYDMSDGVLEYDMSDGVLEFDSLSELEAFISHVHCEPATIFEKNPDTDAYDEAYSI